ncbi:hypothetical protein ACHAAC_07460 [Aeromicrobium sp. CF4.19]|uniref:hypothetical protein n=1 Tax=Aeromicrobium sp. CF4.19 TaxID=3373082 RepID=UPI003EE49F44
MKRRLVAVCATALVLVACGPGDLESLQPVESEPSTQPEETQPEPTPTPEETEDAPEPTSALDAAGLDWPEVSPDSVDWAEVPKAPKGFTDADVAGLAKALRSWAVRAALDPGVWSGKTAPAEVLAPIGATSRHAVAAAGRSVSPRLAVGNVFGKGVDVIGSPRMTTAWRVETKHSTHGPVVRLWLQTRTGYEVERDGTTSVVGVIREHALGALRGGPPQGSLSVAGWFEFGADKCPLALEDALVPGAGGTEKSLERFAKLGSREAYAQPRLGDDERIDAGYLKRCKSKT